MQADLYAALAPVLELLKRLGVRHFVAGSIASSAHGVPRASIDADVVAELDHRHGSDLIAALTPGYYVPEARVAEALRQRTSFSVVHFDTMMKVDVFVARDEADHKALGRVQLARLDTDAEVPVSSPEDTILAKLRWFRRGGEVSERQWADVTGLLRVSQRLDTEYLQDGASAQGVSELLVRAVAEAAATTDSPG